MPDIADVASHNDQVQLDAAIHQARQPGPAVPRGTCLYCRERCDINAVLHTECRPDYEREQTIRRRQGLR